jgi:hypothetical protein
MRTASGFVVENPRELLAGFVFHWYAMYDGIVVAEDNELRVPEIALSTMLNSRISGNTAGAIWLARGPVEEALAEIPAGLDLLDVPESEPIPGEQAISRAITMVCEIHRAKLSIATKILHKKRPGLIHVFDSVVEGQYWPKWCPSVPGRSYGDYAVALTHCFRQDMLSVATELRQMRDTMVEKGTPMTAGRILNVLIWAVSSGNEDWLRGVAATAKSHPAMAAGGG